MEKATTVGVSLRLIGDIYDTDKVSSELKMQPTKKWSQGDPIRSTGKHYGYTAWIFNIGTDETIDVNSQIKKLKDVFETKDGILLKLKDEFDLELSIDVVIIVSGDEFPAIYLDEEVINFSARIGARVDFDVYLN